MKNQSLKSPWPCNYALLALAMSGVFTHAAFAIGDTPPQAATVATPASIQPAATTTAPVVYSPKAKISGGGSEELDRLRMDNAILAEQVKKQEALNKIGSGNGVSVPAFDRTAPIPLAGNAVKSNNASFGSFNVSTALVTMVAGPKNNLVATVQMTNGGTIAVKAGDGILNVGRVKSIEIGCVKVIEDAPKSGKKAVGTPKIYCLPFASEPATSAIVMPTQSSGGLR